MARRRQSELRPEQDAYGQIYQALLEGREAQEIMERDDGLIYAGDPADYFAPYRRWPAVERQSMRAVRGRVLDIGYGAGRVSLHLQARGHDVVAIDESLLAVDVVKRRGVVHAAVRSIADLDQYRVRWQKYATPWFHYLMFSPTELVRLVARTGWRVLRLIDDGSPRYAAVLERT